MNTQVHNTHNKQQTPTHRFSSTSFTARPPPRTAWSTASSPTAWCSPGPAACGSTPRPQVRNRRLPTDHVITRLVSHMHVCFGAADTRCSCSPMALPTDFWAIVFALFPMVLIPCLSSISRKGGVLARMPIPLMSCGGQQKGNREPHPGLGETRKGWGNSSSSSKHFLPGRGGLVVPRARCWVPAGWQSHGEGSQRTRFDSLEDQETQRLKCIQPPIRHVDTIVVPPNTGFQVYPTVPSGYVWGTVVAGSSATQYPGVITISLNMRCLPACIVFAGHICR